MLTTFWQEQETGQERPFWKQVEHKSLAVSVEEKQATGCCRDKMLNSRLSLVRTAIKLWTCL